MAAILGALGVEVVPLPEDAPEPAEDGATFEENARIKAVSAAASLVCLPSRTTPACAWTRWAARRASTPRATARGRSRRAMPACCANMEDQDDRSCRFVCAIACMLRMGKR